MIGLKWRKDGVTISLELNKNSVGGGIATSFGIFRSFIYRYPFGWLNHVTVVCNNSGAISVIILCF